MQDQTELRLRITIVSNVQLLVNYLKCTHQNIATVARYNYAQLFLNLRIRILFCVVYYEGGAHGSHSL